MRGITQVSVLVAVYIAVLAGVIVPSTAHCHPAGPLPETLEAGAGRTVSSNTAAPADLDSPPPAPHPPLSASWKEEFARICAQTEVAASLPAEQLRKLINDSDELLRQLERNQNPQAKIYIFRLRNCRQFFIYSLQLQERGENPNR